MINHTPGPWQYNGTTEVLDTNGWTICELNKDYQSIDECRPNAYLIESAPDLLEALKDAYEFIEEMLDANGRFPFLNGTAIIPCAYQASQAYRDIIAKAEGRAE